MSLSDVRKLRGEIEKQIRVARDTGKVLLGIRNAIRAIKQGKPGEPKVLVIAENAPELERLLYYAKIFKIPYVIYPGTSLELGETLDRPHTVSVVTVIDLGSSELLNYAKNE